MEEVIKKCLTCGGDLEPDERGIPTCKYCGRQYKDAVGEYSSELKEIVNRRQLREFIQAEELGRELLKKQPESSEVYWQILLASLGVVYVQAEGKSKPTFFSYSYDDRNLITDNDDYKNAIKYAKNVETRKYYEEQANELDVLLKEFFGLVAKEASYDIFISFKRTVTATVGGEERQIDTDDYKKATEIYEYLSKKYKVFFSPVSIGQDTGIEGEKYEPRILKALQTSQAMILLGSRTEYLEAQWVQNEWRRFLYFINKGKKNKASLILGYEKYMPALPVALKDIQLPSFDWFKASYLSELESKLSFVKTSKGIRSTIKERKISSDFGAETSFGSYSGKRVAITGADSTGIVLTPTEERELAEANKVLESGNYSVAKTLFEKILQKNGNNAAAYWGHFKACIKARVDGEVPQALARVKEPNFKDIDSAIDCSSDESFSWNIVDVLIGTLKIEGEWSKRKIIYEFVVKYLDDKRVAEVLNYLVGYAKNEIKTDVRVAEDIFGSARKLFFDENKDAAISYIEQYAEALFNGTYYDKARKYYEELASAKRSNMVYMRLLACRVGVTDLSKAKFTLNINPGDDASQKKPSELDLDEIIERILICNNETGDTVIDDRVEEIALYQIHHNRANCKPFIETVISCYATFEKEEQIVNFLMKVAERFIQLKDFKNAKIYYNEILSHNPNYSKAHWGLLMVRFKAIDENDLIKHRKKLIDTPEYQNAKNCADNSEFAHYTDILNGVKQYYKNPYGDSTLKVTDPNKRVYKHITRKKRTIKNSIIAVVCAIILIAGIFGGPDIYHYVQSTYNASVVVDMIDKLGEITLDSGDKITAAEQEYNKLSKEEQDKVKNYNVLVEAKKQFRIEKVIEAINKIGTVSEGSSAAITDAEDKYNALTQKEQDKVTNYNVLVEAKKQYKELEKQYKIKDVIEAINKIGAVSEGSAAAITNAENKYNALTKEEQDKVTNYNVLVEAKKQYKNFADLNFTKVAGGYSVKAKSTYIEGEISIPQKYRGEDVIEIGSGAFSGCVYLSKITIPESIKTVSEAPFEGCRALTTVIWNAIDCVHLEVGTIGDRNAIFKNCSNLTTVTVGDNVKSIPDYAFYNCSGMTSIVFPDSVQTIGDSAFNGCSRLTNIAIPDSVTSIGDSAFNGCSRLTNIAIPNSVTTIGEWAFYNCSGLTSITIPNSVTTIGEYAFSGCRGLTSITIPSSVTTIGSSAFKGCSGLTNIIIPDSVTSIGERAFNGCDSLQSITIPFVGANKDQTGDTHFGYIFGASITSGTTYYNKLIPQSLKTVIISNVATSIGEHAFEDCTGLTSITIPDSVTTIGNYAFYGCNGLTSVTIPDSVTSIDYGAFSGCSGLTGELIIPDSVTTIGGWAFGDCNGLTSVTIGKSVQMIGDRAFYNCYKLVEVYNLSELEIKKNSSNGYVGNYALHIYNANEGSSNIKEVDDFIFYDDGMNVYLLGYKGNKTELTLPNDYDGKSYGIYKYAFYNCSELTSVTIGDSITSIGERAFEYCSGLTSLTIPDSVTSIGDLAFFGCSVLSTIEVDENNKMYKSEGNCLIETTTKTLILGRKNSIIPNEIEHIGDYAFYDCSGLTGELIIPDSVTTIGNYAFEYCSGLTSVTIGDSVKSIGRDAFDGCSSLTSITIGDNVTTIGDGAFSRCSELTSVTIPDSVTSIGDGAFRYCDNLARVEFKNHYNWQVSRDSSFSSYMHIIGLYNPSTAALYLRSTYCVYFWRRTK